MLRPRLRAPRLAASGLALRATINSRRSLHLVPQLKHDYTESGVPDLMSPAGFQIAWADYQGFVVEKLNALTAGSELEDKDTKTISIMTAREPSQAPIFNYASMAHNNHFFFQGLCPGGKPMPSSLRHDLELSFSSVETLRREFVVTASAMFGPGFVWLVKSGPNQYKILTTYLAGSPYSGAHWRRQGSDMNTVGKDGSASEYYRNRVEAMKRKAAAELPPGGIDAEPVLCLNTWEHAWLLDWGVGREGHGGKTAFAEAWWEQIDWEQVARRAGHEVSAPSAEPAAPVSPSASSAESK